MYKIISPLLRSCLEDWSTMKVCIYQQFKGTNFIHKNVEISDFFLENFRFTVYHSHS
jgi:hypothetical protein